jgi:hypothetical protein
MQDTLKMKTKEIEIEYNGEKKKVTIKKLTFGELNQLTEEATDIKVVGGQPLIKVSQKALKELSLLKSITSAPFEVNITNIQNLDAEVGNQLFEEFTLLNQITEKKIS